MNIIETNLSFGAMTVRSRTTRIICHHAAAKTCGAATIHQWHKANGWAGIGYHFVVRKNGTVERGRPEKYVGAHATGSNSDSIGVCFEGNFDQESMGAAQKNAGIELISWLKSKYGIGTVVGHRDVMATSCPGKYFPMADIVNGKVSSTDPDGDVTSGGTTQVQKDQGGAITYQVHARKIGWMNWRCDGDMAGTTGQNRRIEAIRIQPDGRMDVSVHMKTDGDKKYTNINADTLIGTTGKSKRLEALMIEGDKQFRYRVHQKTYGWSAWASNGQWAGVRGKSKQIEAIQIKEPIALIRAHVQGIGWTGYVGDGEVIGTTGKSKRLEALQINPLGMDIKAKAHIQGDGWVDYGAITKDTVIGTTGEKKRLECLCLEGDFEWRAHIAKSGWTDWTEADGVSTLGTVGQSLQMEAIEIRRK